MAKQLPIKQWIPGSSRPPHYSSLLGRTYFILNILYSILNHEQDSPTPCQNKEAETDRYKCKTDIKNTTLLLSTTTCTEQHRLLNTCIGSGYFGSISPGAAAKIIILKKFDKL